MKLANTTGSKTFGAFLLVAGALASACATPSGGETKAESAKQEQPAVLGAALTGNCRLSTVGLPCDPDAEGAATECEGVCWVDDQALVSCRPVAELNLTAVDLNGRICGDADGRNCGQSCENGACVAKNARLGTACRPANTSTTCDGVCTLIDGQPACDEVESCNSVGISPDGCSLTACNFESFALGCVEFALDNPVCEASQEPVVEAGASSGPDTSSTRDAAPGQPDAAADAAADTGANTAGSTGETSSARSESSGESSASDVSSASSAPGDAGRVPVDAGDAGPLPPIDNATKVVGGACSAGHLTVNNNAFFGLVALMFVGLVRRRTAVRRA